MRRNLSSSCFALGVTTVCATFAACSGAPQDPGTESTAPAATATKATGSSSQRITVIRPDSVTVVYLPERRELAAWSVQGTVLWNFTLPNDEQLAGPPVVAANSYLYARGLKNLFAFSPHGEIVWTKELPPLPGYDLAHSPVALSNSGVVTVRDNQGLVAYTNEGTKMWEFDLPSGERMVAGARITPNGAIVLTTEVGLVQVTAEGVMQWYRMLRQPTAAAAKPTP